MNEDYWHTCLSLFTPLNILLETSKILWIFKYHSSVLISFATINLSIWVLLDWFLGENLENLLFLILTWKWYERVYLKVVILYSLDLRLRFYLIWGCLFRVFSLFNLILDSSLLLRFNLLPLLSLLEHDDLLY